MSAGELLPWLRPQPDGFRRLCEQTDALGSVRGNALHQLANYALDGNALHRLARSVGTAIDSGLAAPLANFKLGIVSNATTDFITSSLIASAARHRVALAVVAAPFGATMQVALAADSELLRAKPDGILLALDHRAFFGEHLALDRSEALVDDAIDQVSQMVQSFAAASGAVIIVQTIAAPPERVFGSLDRSQPGTLAWLADRFNDRLHRDVAGPGVMLLDVGAVASWVGLGRWFEPRQWISARLPFGQELLPLYGEYVARLIGAIRGKSHKVLVLDLDNTLWGGVVGDDGVAGLRLGQGDPHGEAFLEMQRAALTLKQRGVLLAICSKNTEAVALAALQEHPEMLLREADFAAAQINWDDKATNLEILAEKLSLGLDSFVFFDDNPVERAQVRAALPQVCVPEIPADPATYARLLLTAGLFESVAFSEEDRSRSAQYAANSQRESLLAKSRDLTSFLQSLDMVATFTSDGTMGWQRFAQLINKSNQYNLTTKRYSEADILALAVRGDLLLQVRLVDRFGDNGMISAIICRPLGEDWEIDTWVMSCRVLNREVEAAALNEIVARAEAVGVRNLYGIYRPTERNDLVRNHYKKLGFTYVETKDGAEWWRLAVATFVPREIPIRVASRTAAVASEFAV